MEYITAAEAAKRWGVSLRQVQRLMAAGRIPCGKKHGREYLIPADAEKPGDPRFEKKAPHDAFLYDLERLIPTVYTSVPRDNPEAIFETISDERLRSIHEGGFAYARGDYAKVLDCYGQSKGDDAAKLCASAITIAAATSVGDYPFFLEVESFLKNIVAANINDSVTALAELSLSTAYLGAMAYNMIPEWLKNGDFSALPPQAKPDAAYKRAKYFQCIGDYSATLAVAQTALTFMDSPRNLSFPGSYLRMMCAVACFALNRRDDAEYWLLDTMRINLPHGFTTCLAELTSMLGGMVERLLEREYPAYYDIVISQQKRTFNNWLTFHNRFTKDSITLILSLREYQIARLAAQNVPDAKIAEQFYISIGRLKTIKNEIYGKLFVKNRKELAGYIL